MTWLGRLIAYLVGALILYAIAWFALSAGGVTSFFICFGLAGACCELFFWGELLFGRRQ